MSSTESAKYGGRRRRLLLLLPRFAAVIASILLLTYVLTYAADSLRAYAFTVLQWQTSQKRAQLALSRCLAHRSLDQYPEFEREAATMQSLMRAIQEGEKRPRNPAAIQNALMGAHVSPSDAKAIVRFTGLMAILRPPLLRKNEESGARAVKRVQQQIEIGSAIKQELESPVPNGARLDELQRELEVIDVEAERDAREFLARTKSLIHQTTIVLLLTIAAGTLVMFYLSFAELRVMLHRLLRTEKTLRDREEQLHQSRKLDAIGQLAAGIAHNFNNLLMVISGATEMIAGHLPIESRPRELAAEVLEATRQGASLTHRLLTFSRKHVTEPQVLELDRLVEYNTQFIERMIGDNIELICSLKAGRAALEIDPSDFTQVLLNLATNARDAMPNGGTLTIRTGLASPREAPAPPSATGYLLMEVSDQGIGMDDETRMRIFDPFFSTKGAGKGSGLGLSTVYGIVKQCDGAITVESQLHRGTVFKVYFPRSQQAASSRPPEPTLKLRAVGGQTILLVEDQEMLREVTAAALELDGYCVITAKTGEDAVEVAKRHLGPIHALLTDVVMPKLSGRDLARILRSVRPQIKVIYMSGYAPSDLFENGVMEAGSAFLQKPFSLRSMSLKLHQMLNAKGKAHSA